jgi:Holliday junction resolvase RusA-like endonuclease
MKITIPGVPFSRARPRYFWKNKKIIVYDPQSNEMKAVRSQMQQLFDEAVTSQNEEIKLEAIRMPQADSFDLACTFIFPVPRSCNRAQKNAKLIGLHAHNAKPDLDNLEKFYFDAGTGIFWKDDAQIAKCSSRKIYGNFPSTEIDILFKQNFNCQ